MSMKPKEKAAVIGGALLLAAVALIQFEILPMDKQKGLDHLALNLGQDPLKKLRDRSGEYLQLKADMDAVREKIIKHKAASGTPLSVLDGIARACGLATNITNMHADPPTAVAGYSVTKVTVPLEGVRVDQVTGFLNKVQTAAAPLGVRYLKLTLSAKTPGAWTAVIEVLSAAPGG